MKKTLFRIVTLACVITIVIACKTNKAGCYYSDVMSESKNLRIAPNTFVCSP